VRQSAERLRIPAVLKPAEIQSLLSHLEAPYQLMVLLAVTTGLRRNELFALKWRDFDFPTRTLQIRRSIYKKTVGKSKSPTSKKDLPLSSYAATELLDWQQQTRYQEANHWVFASPQAHGRFPYRPAMLLTRTIRPAAIRAGIQKSIGWHTFRHTYSTLLVSNGENVKVIQELMRHASSRFTVNLKLKCVSA
jgi:integrase